MMLSVFRKSFINIKYINGFSPLRSLCIMEAPNPNKQLRQVVPLVSSSSGQNQNPNSLPNVSDFNQNNVDLIISSFLSLPDLPSLSSPLSISCSFDRALDNLFRASGDESGQDRLIDRGFQLISLLHESTEKCSRKRATIRNSNSWSLPHELTIKVFSMLDTKSLMQALTCCTMFNKCAMDSLCYSHIDLTTVNVDNKIVRSLIRRAGKELRSLKVGCPDESTKTLLSGSCLAPLSYNFGFLGHHLKKLHLYNNNWLDNKSLCGALSDCSNLTDLKIVGLDIDPLDKILDLLTRKCQHLFIERKIGTGKLKYIGGSSIERNCPNITSLSLIGFAITDKSAVLLSTGLHKLKHLNLSRTYKLNGSFLRDMRHASSTSNLLETIILRDCLYLKEREVCHFLDSILRGYFTSIRHIDVSSKSGLMYEGRRSCKPKFPFEELKEERPDLTFVADFTLSSSSSSSSSSSYSSSPIYYGTGAEEDDDLWT